MKDEEIYNIFNTHKILNRPAKVSIDSHSGLAGIAYWINTYYNLPDEEKVDKKIPLIAKMKEMIDKEYEEGRNTVMGDEELDDMIRIIDPKLHKVFSVK